MDLKDINTFGSIIHTKNNKYIGILYDPYFTKFQGIIEKELKIIDDIFPQNILNNLLDKQNKDNDDKKKKIKKKRIKYQHFLYNENFIRKSEIGTEFFSFKKGFLVYKLFPSRKKKNIKVIIDLDIRPLKRFPEWNRIYTVKEEKGFITVNYEYKDEGKGIKSYEKKIQIYKGSLVKKDWIEKEYDYERIRGSKSKLWVYRLEIDCKSDKNGSVTIIIDLSGKTNKKKVIATRNFNSINMDNIKEFIKEYKKKIKRIEKFISWIEERLNNRNEKTERELLYFLKGGFKDPSIKKVFEEIKKDVSQSLRKFVCNYKIIGDISNEKNRTENNGIFLRAGYPYFIEEWIRDELIGLGGIENKKIWASVLRRNFKRLFQIDSQKDFQDNSRYKDPREGYKRRNDYKLEAFPSNTLLSSDAPYWFWIRLMDYVEKFGLKKKEKEGISLVEAREMFSYIKEFIDIAEKTGEKYGVNLPVSNENETWMDTNKRKGIAIEIAMMHIKLYEYLKRIESKEELSLGIDKEWIKEKIKKGHHYIRELFLKKGSYKNNHIKSLGSEEYISSGYINDVFPTDGKKRPNILLGIYADSELLSKEETIWVLDNIIKEHFIEWGGITSISKYDPDFKPYHTGENNESYHNGDVWFYINNIAAIIMLKTAPEKYLYYALKILLSSLRDFYKGGLVMNCSEISSANEYQPFGCHAQLWSTTSLIELLNLFCKEEYSNSSNNKYKE